MQSIAVTDSNPIVQVRGYFSGITIHWLLGKRCNFDCSYCPDEWHDKTSKNHSMEKLQAAWNRILSASPEKDIKYNLSFLGGEPTLNKNFLPFLKWLHECFGHNLENVGVVTNGTASLEYYKELINYCDWIVFSTHSEFMKEKKFFNTVLNLHQIAESHKCLVSVNIMDEPWHQVRNEQYKTFLKKHGIFSRVRPISDFGEGRKQFPIKITNQMDFS
jgi:organic radical activating enzyme